MLAGSALVLALVTPPAPAPTSFPAPERAPEVASSPRIDERTTSQRKRDQWMLSLEGVVHAPSDIGVQASVELPFRLRLSSGFGFMPVKWLTAFVASTTSDEQAKAVLELPSYTGTIWRAELGFRPFRRVGFYVDTGYARATIHGSFRIPDTLLGEAIGVDGGYTVESSLDIWLLQAGYQWELANRAVLALGLGVMSTFHAETNITATGQAPTSSEFTRGAERANQAFERYGTIPFLTLRAGVDLL
ncbi:MAG TPA: hypothetical protein VMS65_05335 [Polyangiaceae bacterium]|nr:hypothetical protein [Polyangiaceae bacterium]